MRPGAVVEGVVKFQLSAAERTLMENDLQRCLNRYQRSNYPGLFRAGWRAAYLNGGTRPSLSLLRGAARMTFQIGFRIGGEQRLLASVRGEAK